LQSGTGGMPFPSNLSPRRDTIRPHAVTAWPVTLLLSLLVLPACGTAETPTSATTTTTTTTVASPTTTEEFTGTVSVGGSSFYSFTVAENGTVNVTLASVGGAGVPSTVWMGLGVGTPSGEDCSTTTLTNGPAGSSPQVSTVYAPGIYCVKVADIGNLAQPATFTVTIAHP
jgi:hypothetical protein